MNTHPKRSLEDTSHMDLDPTDATYIQGFNEPGNNVVLMSWDKVALQVLTTFSSLRGAYIWDDSCSL